MGCLVLAGFACMGVERMVEGFPVDVLGMSRQAVPYGWREFIVVAIKHRSLPGELHFGLGCRFCGCSSQPPDIHFKFSGVEGLIFQ